MKRFAPFVVLLPVLFACERQEATAPTTPPPTTQSSPQPTPPPTAPTQPAPAPEPVEPATAPTSGASGSGDYTVAEGDTLSGIAQEHGVNRQDLAKWNNIKDPDRIYPGQTLQLTGS